MVMDSNAQQSVPDPTQDASKRQSAAAKQAVNKQRGSEFKKTAQ